MKSTTQLVALGLASVLLLITAPSVMAQPNHDHNQISRVVWKTGMLRLSKSAWAGNVRLKSGMYHVKHIVDGGKHMIAIREVSVPAGNKEFSMWEGREVARLECSVEPVTKKVRNTKVRFAKNAAGDLVIQEIQIAGEDVKHILLENSPRLSQVN